MRTEGSCTATICTAKISRRPVARVEQAFATLDDPLLQLVSAHLTATALLTAPVLTKPLRRHLSPPSLGQQTMAANPALIQIDSGHSVPAPFPQEAIALSRGSIDIFLDNLQTRTGK